MAKYAQIGDCVDPALTVSALNLTEADVYVDLALGNIGITPVQAAAIVLPNATLTAIAANWAKNLAAIEGAMGENELLMNKADRYKKNAEALVKQLNRTALGLVEPTGTGYSTLTIGRD
jgi:hypothetical protein